MTYEVNTANAISETLDGESIIINLKSGMYFSLNASGSIVWDGIVAKQSPEAIVEAVASRYDAAHDVVESSVKSMIESLKQHELIVETTNDASAPLAPFSGQKQAFIPPSLETYDDMREMLLADPIHDVADVGWPKLRQE